MVRDEKVLDRIPVELAAPSSGRAYETAIEKVVALCALASNQKRLRVMLELARGSELRFSDVMRIVTNPKLAQDCLRPLLNEGLILHGEKGSAYRASRRGVAFALAVSLAGGPLLDLLEAESGSSP